MPIDVKPQNVNFFDYHVNLNQMTQKIDTITHHSHGPVQFRATEIDKEAGYILSSVMRIYSTIYTHKPSGLKMLNLIHCHLNDTGDDVTFDVVHMKPANKKDKEGP